jgi:RNA polymerase sigma factor (sigma-70 family)
VQPAKELALEPSAAVPWRVDIDAVFQEHYPRIVAMLARLTGDRAQAEELAADTFCKLSARGPAAEDAAPWLYRVATNAGLDALRVNSRRRIRERQAHIENLRTASADGALDRILREEQRARVQSVLAEMKPRDAELLLLRQGGLAYRELANALGVQASSIGTLLARAETDFERRFRARYGEGI